MDVAMWARVPCDAEIFGLFSDLIPAEALQAGGELDNVRGRQGKVPDLRLRLSVDSNGQVFPQVSTDGVDTLCELKVINAGVSRYPRGEDQGRLKAVDRRARQLQKEYENKLGKLDSQLHGTPEGQTGPLVRRLRSYPRLQSFVVGAFGEVSEDLHSLVNHLAGSREKYMTQTTGYSLSSRERSQIVGQIRRQLSTAFTRANSLCTLSRVMNVGPNSRAAAKRREWAMLEEEGMRRERRNHWNVYIRGGGLSRGNIHFFPGS